VDLRGLLPVPGVLLRAAEDEAADEGGLGSYITIITECVIPDFPRLKIESVPTSRSDSWLKKTIPSASWNVGTIDFQDLGKIRIDALLFFANYYL
jgi:hypothetical protein